MLAQRVLSENQVCYTGFMPLHFLEGVLKRSTQHKRSLLSQSLASETEFEIDEKVVRDVAKAIIGRIHEKKSRCVGALTIALFGTSPEFHPFPLPIYEGEGNGMLGTLDFTGSELSDTTRRLRSPVWYVTRALTTIRRETITTCK